MARKRKIVIVAKGERAHVSPTLPLVGELRRADMDVDYITTPSHMAAVTAAGARGVAYEAHFTGDGDTVGPDEESAPGTWSRRLLAEAEQVLPQVLPRLREAQADAVLYDAQSLAGRLAAGGLGLPMIAYHVAYASNESFSLPKHAEGSAAGGVARREATEAVRRLSATFGLAPFTVHGLFAEGAPLNIVYLPRSFQPQGESFDERFHFVGPSLGEREAGPGFPGEVLERKPLVLAAFEASRDRARDVPLQRLCLEAFRDAPGRLVLAACPSAVEALARQAPHATVRADVPRAEALAHADAFVTDGDLDAVMEALWFAVPTVVIPRTPLQAFTGARLAALGLGRVLPREGLTAAALRQAVDGLARDEGTRARLAVMQKEVRGAGGCVKAAEAITAYVELNAVAQKCRSIVVRTPPSRAAFREEPSPPASP